MLNIQGETEGDDLGGGGTHFRPGNINHIILNFNNVISATMIT